MTRPSQRRGAPADDPVDIDRVLADLSHATTPQERETLEELVVERSARLVGSAAGRYERRGVDRDDLVAVANLALVKAVRGFVPERGDFFAYASATIHGDLKKHFRDQGWTIRPPRQVQELQAAVSHAVADLESDGHTATPAEIAHVVGATEREVTDARAASGCFRPTSIDALGPSGTALADRLPDDQDDFAAVDDWASFTPLWRDLSDDDRLLLRLRFFEELSQDRIAPHLGISQMQVSRRLTSLLSRLRDSAGVADAVA